MSKREGILAWSARWKKRIDANLRRLLPRGRDPLSSAMRYAVFPGGKRLRSLLCLAAAEDCGAGKRPIDAASALELIHSYSLVHDDLPSMDDDDLRRGKPSCHVRYGEATAILAGDGLQALAFAAAAGSGLGAPAVAELAQAGGPGGMVGGQALDIGRRAGTLAALRRMHSLKTGSLFAASLRLGAMASGAGRSRLDAYSGLARHFGLCFQIADDIADATEPSDRSGKRPVSDRSGGNATYVTVLGLERARSELERERRALADACSGAPSRNGVSRVRQLTESLFGGAV